MNPFHREYRSSSNIQVNNGQIGVICGEIVMTSPCWRITDNADTESAISAREMLRRRNCVFPNYNSIIIRDNIIFF